MSDILQQAAHIGFLGGYVHVHLFLLLLFHTRRQTGWQIKGKTWKVNGGTGWRCLRPRGMMGVKMMWILHSSSLRQHYEHHAAFQEDTTPPIAMLPHNCSRPDLQSLVVKLNLAACCCCAVTSSVLFDPLPPPAEQQRCCCSCQMLTAAN